MPLGFGHLTFAWLIGKCHEKLNKLSLSRYEWFLLLFGAIFPDIDFLFDWTLGFKTHRGITHSLVMVFLGFMIIYLACRFINKELNGKRLGMFFAMGISLHLIADIIWGYPGVTLLWPLNYRFWLYGFVNNYTNVTLNQLSQEKLVRYVKFAIVDIGIGVAWIGYLFFKGKIKEF